MPAAIGSINHPKLALPQSSVRMPTFYSNCSSISPAQTVELVGGYKTRASLENEFWEALRDIE
jgi:hypothetical protein